jgi:hypothetical protein
VAAPCAPWHCVRGPVRSGCGGRPFNTIVRHLQMGYEAHITRRKSWSDAAGPAITEREWLAKIGDDPDLTALVWNDGNVDVKNPDERLVRKMVSVAAALGATVQGDDGESYDSAGNPVAPPRPGILSRVVAWFVDRTTPAAEPLAESSLPFKVGDRVRDALGHLGSVTEIDVRAAHGLGRITVKYEDGRTGSWTAAAHGLERVDA